MKQQLHRSVTFWSGLLVMTFIGWAWRDSWQAQSAALAWRGGVASNFGGVVLCALPFEVSPKVSHDRLPVLEGGHPAESLALPLLPVFHQVPKGAGPADGSGVPPGTMEAFRLQIDASISARRIHRGWIYLPYWNVLTAVGGAWLALLYWRARRRKRSITP